MLTIPHALEVDPAFAPMLRLAENIYLTPRELAKHWRLTIGHLSWLRRRGKGPAYIKIAGRVIYSHADILAYEIANRRGPVTPDSLALALGTVPALSPATRDLIAAHVSGVLFRRERKGE